MILGTLSPLACWVTCYEFTIKVLASRMKTVLHKVGLTSHNSFVRGDRSQIQYLLLMTDLRSVLIGFACKHNGLRMDHLPLHFFFLQGIGLGNVYLLGSLG